MSPVSLKACAPVQISAGAGKQDTSSDALREVCENTLKDTCEGGETARTGSVLFDASFVVKLLTLSRNASHGRRMRSRQARHPAREI